MDTSHNLLDFPHAAALSSASGHPKPYPMSAERLLFIQLQKNLRTASTAALHKERDVGHGTLPSRADDVCWQLTHYHHRHVIQKAAYTQNATGENNQIGEQCVLEGSTIWWFAAFLFLLGFSTPDIIVKSTGGPATPPVPFAPSSSKQLPALSR